MAPATQLPTAAEINIHNSWDEQTAVQHFLGRSLKQAETMFHENSLYYQDDMMFMGPKAYCYYLRAYLAFLTSDTSDADNVDVMGFVGTLELRFKKNIEAYATVFDEVLSAFDYIDANLARFEIGTREYWEDAERRIEEGILDRTKVTPEMYEGFRTYWDIPKRMESLKVRINECKEKLRLESAQGVSSS